MRNKFEVGKSYILNARHDLRRVSNDNHFDHVGYRTFDKGTIIHIESSLDSAGHFETNHGRLCLYNQESWFVEKTTRLDADSNLLFDFEEG